MQLASFRIVAAVAVLSGCHAGLPTSAASPPAVVAVVATEPEPVPAAEEARPSEEIAEPADVEGVPTTCTPSSTSGCVMAPRFAEQLCRGTHPDLALALFRRGTPWRRGYVARQVEAWSTAGFARTSAVLDIDEEVLVISQRAGSGMLVGGGSYDVLRWDGTCVSLMADEVSFRPPRAPKHARIPWPRLDDEVRVSLSHDAKIRAVDSQWRKQCAKERSGPKSPGCAEVDERLSGGIVAYLRAGGAIPTITRQ
jgi:hypothetical protein